MPASHFRKDIIESFRPLFEAGFCDCMELVDVAASKSLVFYCEKDYKPAALSFVLKKDAAQLASELAAQKVRRDIDVEGPSGMVFCSVIPDASGSACLLVQSRKPFPDAQKKILSALENAMRIAPPSEKGDTDSRYRDELMKMRSMQAKLSPRFDEVKGLDIASVFLPAALMSGSFIDAKFLDEKTYQITACDVLGYDSSSNFTSAAIRTLIQSFSSSKIMPSSLIDMVVERLKKMPSVITSIIYMTVYQINIENGQLRVSSYGDISTIYYNAQKKGFVNLGETSIGMDLAKRSICKDMLLMLGAGDAVLFYSQGAIGAKTEDGSGSFGESRLMSAMKENIATSSKDVAHSLTDSIYTFTNYAPTREDILLLCVKKI